MTRLVVLLLAATLAAGCSDDSDGLSADAQLAGSYTLRSLNGQNLPIVEEEGGIRFELLSATLTINETGSFTERQQFRVTQGTTVITDEALATGTWTRSGSTVTLTGAFEGEAPQTFSGTWNGENQITFTDSGDVWVYRK